MTYAKREGRDTWHFVRTCSNYPSGGRVVTRSEKPKSGELCNECQAKAIRAAKAGR